MYVYKCSCMCIYVRLIVMLLCTPSCMYVRESHFHVVSTVNHGGHHRCECSPPKLHIRCLNMLETLCAFRCVHLYGIPSFLCNYRIVLHGGTHFCTRMFHHLHHLCLHPCTWCLLSAH